MSEDSIGWYADLSREGDDNRSRTLGRAMAMEDDSAIGDDTGRLRAHPHQARSCHLTVLQGKGATST
jgi:hypothetical protein